MPPCINQATLDVIRFMIPYVRLLRDQNPGFPEGYCDATSVQVVRHQKVRDLGVRLQFGRAGDINQRGRKPGHVWVTWKGVNIDFTAHQFTVLESHVVDVDGFVVVVGSDEYFKGLGYEFDDFGAAEEERVMDVMDEIRSGDLGNLDGLE